MDLKNIAAATILYECYEEESAALDLSHLEDCIDLYLSLVENNRDTFERVYRCMVNDYDGNYYRKEDVEAVRAKFE